MLLGGGSAVSHTSEKANELSSTEMDLNEIRSKIRIGPPWLTRFERARVIGARALQISMGAPVLIDASKLPSSIREDPVLLAKKELELGVLPLTIVRYTRRGDQQAIPVRWLLELDRRRVRIH
jgi:DNA-directed RNA polymerase I, II, and III subunit RPABC2/DNA-directed RNA polymerase subunit K